MKINYVIGSGNRELEQLIEKLTFPTKHDTADDYPFHITISSISAWRAPRNPTDKAWGQVLPLLKYLESI